MNDALKPLREKIDTLDDQILDLLNERAKVVLEVGENQTGQQIGLLCAES